MESDSEFVIAPLGSPTGVRALRVRRRLGVDEWLWVEYNSHAYGALVRRETPDSGQLTHLLDMTPAALDEARIDLGVSSEALPALPPGSTWSDPHSDLTLSVGYPRSEGLPVFVRYADRCAQPELGTVTVSDAEQDIRLPVDAGPECDWEVRSGRTWIGASREGGDALIRVSAIAGNLHRAGVVSIGRKAVRVIQKGPPLDMMIVSVSPPGPGMPLDASVPFLLYLRDENGVEDMQALQLSVIPQSGSAAAPCYFRYSATRRVVEVSADGTEFRDDESPDIGRSGSCALEAMIYRVNGTDIIFRFFLRFAGAEGEALTAAVRAEDADGVAGPWVQAAAVTTTRQCRSLPTTDYLTYLPIGATGQRLTIQASPSPCAWTATADAEWIRLAESSGADGGALRYDIAANTESGQREGRIMVNGVPVRVIQYGNGEVQPLFVTLRPSETVVSCLPGAGALTFFYGLGDLVPAMSESPWLRVTRVERSADRREVHFQFEANIEPTPRLGTIVVGGKPFTVLQQPWPVR